MKRQYRIIPPSIRSTGGFTLLEMMIVMGLMGLIAVFALPTVTSYFKVSLNSSARELASVVKESYNSAVMTGRVHRIVYDFKENAFWAEEGNSTVLLDTAESKARDEKRKRFSRLSSNDQPKDSGFKMDRSITRGKVKLPRGVVFEDLLTEQSREPVTEGTGYTHIFPTGFTEQTIVHLKDTSDHHISLVISPLVGRTRLIERYVKEDEALQEPSQ